MLDNTPAPIPGSPYRALDYGANVGAWAGALDEVRWGYELGWLRSQVRRALIRRRWFEVLVCAGPYALLVTIRDEGIGGFGAVCLADLERGEIVARARRSGRPLQTLVVGPFAQRGTDAFVRVPGLQLELRRGPDDTAWTLVVRADGLSADLVLDSAGAPPAATVIGEHAHRRPALVSRAQLLTVRGRLELHQRAVSVSDASASVEYGNGFHPARAGGWRRLAGIGRTQDGQPVGFAFTDGARAGRTHEAWVWGADDVGRAAPVTVLVGGRPQQDVWRCRPAGCAFDLHFQPRVSEGSRARRPIGAYRGVLALGTFHGTLPSAAGPVRLAAGVGIGEDHRLR